MEAVCYCDGGNTLGKKFSGYCSYRIEFSEHIPTVLNSRIPLFHVATNNEAEYEAMYLLLVHLYYFTPEFVDSFVVYSDSQLVVKTITDEWVIRKDTLLPYYIKAKGVLSKLRETHNIEIKWVPRKIIVEKLGH